MKKVKLLSLFLAMVLFINVCSPVVEAMGYSIDDLNNVCVDGNIVVYGVQDDEKIYNFVLNLENKVGQFAVKYENKPDYVYEYIFNCEKEFYLVSLNSILLLKYKMSDNFGKK